MTEQDVEQLTIDLLRAQGYTYVYGPDIAPGGDRAERRSFGDLLLSDRLRAAIDRLNPEIPPDARLQAYRDVTSIASPELIVNNEHFHTILTNGIDVEYQQGGITRGNKVWLIDFEHADINEFLVVNQFTVLENNVNKRPDVILFVNGLPLVVIELKTPKMNTRQSKKPISNSRPTKRSSPLSLPITDFW